MKKYFLSKYIIGCLLLTGATLGFTACEDDANDWGVDDSKAQMFTPVTFETSKISATAVDLAFSTVPNAKSYIVEYSKDSLQFSAIVGNMELLADDLIVDSTSTNKRYLVPLKDLDAATRYSARIKATSNNGLPESKWAEVTFKTPSEQVFNPVTAITGSSALLSWEPGIAVTHIYLLMENGPLTEITLTPENISTGKLTLNDLKENTNYAVVIYNNEIKRGSIIFKTDEKIPEDGVWHELKATDNIVDYLNNVSDEKVVLILPAGSSYEIGAAWELPAQIKHLILWGRSSETGDAKAVINFKEIKLAASVTEFAFRIHNMTVTGTDASADYVMNDNPSKARTITEFKLDGCDISSFRGVFRMRGVLTVNNIEIDNCIINNIGSYGVVISDAAAVSAGNISLTNSTVYNINNGDVMKFKSKVSSISIKASTFYNAQSKDRYLLSFDGKAANLPSSLGVNRCLFAGADASVTVRGTNPKMDGQFVFNSYKTSDYVVADNYPLLGVEDYSKTSSDLFENPEEGNFKIKDISIGGDAQPGDPRWW